MRVGLDTDTWRPLTNGGRNELNSPVVKWRLVEWLNKGLMAAWSPRCGRGRESLPTAHRHNYSAMGGPIGRNLAGFGYATGCD
eukprot:2867528-Pyramimonas_sp.AAC.1